VLLARGKRELELVDEQGAPLFNEPFEIVTYAQ
jgi:hypothetical protein